MCKKLKYNNNYINNNNDNNQLMLMWKNIEREQIIILRGERDETTNHRISECCKLPQKRYKTRDDRVGKVIHWELCKKLKFDRTNKWNLHKAKSDQENETRKIICDFETPTDQQISATRLDLIIIKNKKRTCWIVDFAVPVDHDEIERMWKCYKIAEGFRFMPLSLARVRNFRLSTWVS